VKKLILGLAAAGILLAGCGNGNDTLAKVVGPNPISDVHAAVNRFSDSGWNDGRKAAFAQKLYDEYSSSGLTLSVATCISDWYSKNFSWDDVTNPNRYPTASEEAAAEAAIERCAS
jgi:hypothetical protein